MSRKLKILIAIVLLIAISFLGLYLFKIFNEEEDILADIDKREISVQILNGCGISGLAREYEEFLVKKFEEYGANMFKFSEASNTRKSIYNKSIIVVVREVDFAEEPNNLEILQERTGIENWIYAIDENEKPDNQFIIIIGNDFQNLMEQEREYAR